ncbi:MAG TPA: hypothetical protein VGZ47_23585 [Gemmataceae bacterium]|jgi:hypothetical protein|nr:hypothetical protein [Gemmataceae bacterium]
MIEHLLILLVQQLEKEDRAERASLHQAIPGAHELQHDPDYVLQQREIIIGPTRQRNMATFAGLLLAGLVAVVLNGAAIIVVEVAQGWNAVPDWAIFLAAALAIADLIALTVYVTRRVRRWYEGGKIIMRRHSVEFQYRNECVYCPWSLFRVGKSVVREQSRQLRLAINPAAREYLQMDRGGETVAQGAHVNPAWFRFAREDELVLKVLYAIQPTELGRLLHHLGNRLA